MAKKHMRGTLTKPMTQSHDSHSVSLLTNETQVVSGEDMLVDKRYSRKWFGCAFCGFHQFFPFLALFRPFNALLIFYRGGSTKAAPNPYSRVLPFNSKGPLNIPVQALHSQSRPGLVASWTSITKCLVILAKSHSPKQALGAGGCIGRAFRSQIPMRVVGYNVRLSGLRFGSHKMIVAEANLSTRLESEGGGGGLRHVYLAGPNPKKGSPIE